MKFITIVASAALVLGACGGEKTDNGDPSQQAQELWDELNEAERGEMCLGYAIVGPEVLLERADESEYGPEVVEQLLHILQEECL